MQLSEERETFMRRSVICMVLCVAGCNTTWSPSLEVLLFEGAPLAFAQPNAFCKATGSFQTSRWSVGLSIRLSWKALLGWWNTTKNNGFIWLAGHATSQCCPRGIFQGDRLPGNKPSRSRHCHSLFMAGYSAGLKVPYSRPVT